MQLTLARARTGIQLGQELGRGGEGTVYRIEGRMSEVAKLYGSPPDQRKVQKLLAMAESGNPAILRIAAWPIDLLVDDKGVTRGFIMPRITAHRDIHELYSPKSRSDAFPEADFRFLVHVAANIARAFAVVHDHGSVLGDVNHGNVLVGTDGKVMLIDCDSFQVRNGTRLFTCDVGVPLFTAPELHGLTFRGLQRTPNHDRFGLAVLIFHLLCLGRHPFAGRYSGSGEMTIERAIAEYRFAYGPDRVANKMDRPPGTIVLEAVGNIVADLFVRAFGRSGGNGQRPEAKVWVSALKALETNLRSCSKASWHYFPGELASCPWCTVEAQAGIRLFGLRIATLGPIGAIDVGTLWRAIAAVPDPGQDPTLPSERPWNAPHGVDVPSGAAKVARKVLSIGLVCAGFAACNALAKDGGVVAGLIAYGLALAVWPRVSSEKRTEATRAYSTAEADWEAAMARWRREASREVFVEEFKALEEARNELSDLPNERQRRLVVLDAEREAHQRQRYLDRFHIDRAKIKGIGPGRTAMLASYGIETAADIDSRKIYQIPGFGQTLTSDLLQWRRGHEQNFRFNANEPVDPRDMSSMDSELGARKQSLVVALTQGPAMLQRLNQEIVAGRSRLMPVLERAWSALKITEAHLNAV